MLQNSGLVIGWPNSVGFVAQPPVALLAGAVPTAITSGDIGLDGDLDLVVTMRPSNLQPAINLVIWGNDGSGAFPSGNGFATGPGPVDVAIGDVDHDHDLDLATANWNGDTPDPDADLTILRNDFATGTCCHDFLAGVDDAFATTVAPFSEVSCPRSPLAAWLAPRRDFDGAALSNLGFGHTFMQLPGRIIEATLTLEVTWDGANNLNDRLSLAWDGGVFGPMCWTVPLSQLIDPVGNDISGTVTLDLGSLPGGLDLRPWLNATGMLDVAIEDDTLVDHLHLHLVTSCPGGCSCTEAEAELGLSVTPLVLGGVANFTITGAPPFSITALLVGAGVGCSGFPGLCLNPYIDALAVVMADGSGTATYPITLPTGLLLPPCMLIHTQAVAIDPPLMGMHWSCTLSTYTYAN
ncbi:MAG: VCBS repeat-containing protein [Planctomycetes bacterium]|nr:VCBS repeat-containing protein [Planctomycetota bacterium]